MVPSQLQPIPARRVAGCGDVSVRPHGLLGASFRNSNHIPVSQPCLSLSNWRKAAVLSPAPLVWCHTAARSHPTSSAQMGTHGASTTQGCMAVKCEGGSLRNYTGEKLQVRTCGKTSA